MYVIKWLNQANEHRYYVLIFVVMILKIYFPTYFSEYNTLLLGIVTLLYKRLLYFFHLTEFYLCQPVLP